MAEDKKRSDNHVSERSRQQSEQHEDLSATVHCPWCHRPLVVMMGAHGPFFFCGCVTHKQNEQAQE